MVVADQVVACLLTQLQGMIHFLIRCLGHTSNSLIFFLGAHKTES